MTDSGDGTPSAGSGNSGNGSIGRSDEQSNNSPSSARNRSIAAGLPGERYSLSGPSVVIGEVYGT